jgi:hypothetical protein
MYISWTITGVAHVKALSHRTLFVDTMWMRRRCDDDTIYTTRYRHGTLQVIHSYDILCFGIYIIQKIMFEYPQKLVYFLKSNRAYSTKKSYLVHLIFSPYFSILNQFYVEHSDRSIDGLRVRIPPGSLVCVCCDCCVLSGRGLSDQPITRQEESYRLWCV